MTIIRGIFKYTVRTLFYLRNTVRIYWAPSPTATSVSTTKNCGRVFRFASTWICDVKIVELYLLRVSVGDVDFHDIVSADWDSNFEIFDSDFRFQISISIYADLGYFSIWTSACIQNIFVERAMAINATQNQTNNDNLPNKNNRSYSKIGCIPNRHENNKPT